MASNFYDKVAKKFGGYKTGSRYTKVFSGKDPEKVFSTKLHELSKKEKAALDLGCGDGRFTLSLAPHFKTIVGIDTSEGMLSQVRELKKQEDIDNVRFQKQNAAHASFEDGSFDVVFSRRGPTPYAEVYRLLKPRGMFVVIRIGEKDTLEIKKVFGRGQGYGRSDFAVLDEIQEESKRLGFLITFAEEYFYDEYYQTLEDLDLFLQGVPIFEDFDSRKDNNRLEAYAKRFSTKRGIKLERHRVVFLLQKPSDN